MEPRTVRVGWWAVMVPMVLAGGCAEEHGETASVREPLVDAESGRVEEIPDTELPAASLRAAELTGERREAAERHTDRVLRAGMRTVTRRGREFRDVAFANLGPSEMAAHFDDARLAGGHARGMLVRSQLATARAEAASRPDARPPTATQESALLGIEARAMTDLRVDWDDLRGSPRRIAGALHVSRAAPEVVGAEWAESNWASLAEALAADADDTIELVHVGELPDETTSVTYRRVRGGVPMPENLVEIHVTNQNHRAGEGLVLRVEAQWDTDVAPGSAPADQLGEEEALLLAQDALGVEFPSTDMDADLRWRCAPSEGPSCRPTWRVQWHRANPADSDGPDSVYLDARTGEVLNIARDTHDYTGHVSQTTNYAGDTGDVLRDMRLAEMRQWFFVWGYSNTDTNGNYNWSPPSASAEIGLHSRPNTTVMEVRRAEPASCGAAGNYDWQPLNLSTGGSFVIAPNATNHRRSDWLMFHYLNYAIDMYWQFSNIEEMPKAVWFNASGPGGGSAFAPCDATAETGALTVGGNGDDTAAFVGNLRDIFWEEIHHGTEWCIQTVGAGCGYTNLNPRSLTSGWGHAQGGAIGSYVNDYETRARGQATSNHLRYAGPTAVGDVFLHDAEIEGAATSGTDGCWAWGGGTGTYTCAADEACFRTPAIAAMDRPRCMKRASSTAQCISMFPSQPWVLLDRQTYGSDPANPNGGIGICVSNDYANGRIWMHLGEHLMTSAGYFAGVGSFHRANRALTRTRQFTQTSDNFHHAMAPWAGHYEASNAFHNMSTESFAWLDDTTDRWNASEVIRTPRNTTLTFTQGGPTGTSVAFQQGLYAPGAVYDDDSYLLLADQGETYEITASTSSGSVDLCLQAWNHMTGALLGTASGCSDGTGNRNATLTLSVGTATRVDFVVSNVLNQTGVYQLQVRNTTDDYPDQLSFNLTSQPLRNATAVSGSLNSTSDKDLFHYYAPPGTSGTLTVTTTGAATSALVQIYQASAPGIPGGSPVASGWGGASTAISAGSMYYVLLDALGATGAYTLTASHSGCGTCNPNGTFTSPLPLPNLNGGIVTNRLDQSAAPPNDTWTQCENGTTCDWYAVDLVASERLTITTFNVFDSLCDVEVSVFSDTQQNYWNNGTLRAPMTWDLFGSMEANGSQLTFQAPRDGTYRIRVRALELNCPRYDMAVTRGVVDMGPPTIH